MTNTFKVSMKKKCAFLLLCGLRDSGKAQHCMLFYFKSIAINFILTWKMPETAFGCTKGVFCASLSVS